MEVQHKFPASAVAGEERQKAKPITAIKTEPFPKQEQLKLGRSSMEVKQKFLKKKVCSMSLGAQSEGD